MVLCRFPLAEAARNGFFDFDELDKAYAALSPDAAETDGGESVLVVRTKKKAEKKGEAFFLGSSHMYY